jgi:2-oxoacid dehydrogenases acyltransferase (catalytic domain)
MVQAAGRNSRHQLGWDVRPGGWLGYPDRPPTLMITVGGIATKPRYVDGKLQARELLDLTISVDHEVVDGAPAARFARRLAELVEQADGRSAGRR